MAVELDTGALDDAAVPLEGSAAVTSAELEVHVRALSADDMEGRGVGTQGLDRAADYVAAGFASAGLSPAGDEGFMQPFEVTVGATLGPAEGQRLTIGAEEFTFGTHWRPFSFSQTGEVKAKLAFAGYGVRAPDLHYDDYQGVDVAGRVVVVLRHAPAHRREGSPFSSKDAARYADLRYKAFAARSQGAVGLIVVNDPLTYAGSDEDVPYIFGSGSEGHIPAVHLTWRGGGERLAKAIGLDMVATQTTIDAKPAPESRLLDAEATLRVDIQRTRARVRNVVGLLLPEGMSTVANASDVIVVGAHYDHLGHGGEGSLAPDSKEVHNGADDNASGTAILMELAAALSSRRSSLRRPIYFVAFTGEEIGLRGSEYWVTHAPVESDRIAAMVNFDMVGRLRGDKLYVGGVGTALEFEQLVSDSAGDKLEIAVGRDGFGPSDHSVFYGRKVPVLFLFTGAHDEYHTPADDADLLNYPGMATVGGFAYRTLYYLAAAPSRPFYTQADRRREGDSGGAGGRGYGAYLGTVPSFAEYEGKGVVLQGVRDGSPAQVAGIRGGDILVGIDDGAIDDLYEFTYALRDHKPGDKVVVKVLRDGEPLSFEAVLGERKK